MPSTPLERADQQGRRTSADEHHRDIRHAIHGSLFAIDVAMSSVVRVEDHTRRAEIVRAAQIELQQVHERIGQLIVASRELPQPSTHVPHQRRG